MKVLNNTIGIIFLGRTFNYADSIFNKVRKNENRNI